MNRNIYNIGNDYIQMNTRKPTNGNFVTHAELAAFYKQLQLILAGKQDVIPFTSEDVDKFLTLNEDGTKLVWGKTVSDQVITEGVVSYSVAPEYNPEKNYLIGELMEYNGDVYKYKGPVEQTATVSETELPFNPDEWELIISKDRPMYSYIQTTDTSFMQGKENESISWGASLIQGYKCIASEHAIAQGGEAYAGICSMAQGQKCKAGSKDVGYNIASFAQGKHCYADVMSLSQGNACHSYQKSLAQGDSCSASNYAQALGYGCIANNGMSIGRYNSTTDAAFVIGNGSNNNNRDDLFMITKKGEVKTNGSMISNGGTLTVSNNSVTVNNNSLTLVKNAGETLTINVTVPAGLIADTTIEVTPTADCSVTIKNGNIVLMGNTQTLTSGHKYQIKVLGSCWTATDFGDAYAVAKTAEESIAIIND